MPVNMMPKLVNLILIGGSKVAKYSITPLWNMVQDSVLLGRCWLGSIWFIVVMSCDVVVFVKTYMLSAQVRSDSLWCGAMGHESHVNHAYASNEKDDIIRFDHFSFILVNTRG